ncbi:hypothetical protein Pan54_40070 [Rubinisphaera italica]|uniref:Uncharacterized protein n=1 Tax=Rubinisphaera italica TaxID=2527969 RepID=A0A5C5XK74_9PLAN|nr:hypothetical protein Pan54_40070 [Rubinisphaera italica]
MSSITHTRNKIKVIKKQGGRGALEEKPPKVELPGASLMSQN